MGASGVFSLHWTIDSPAFIRHYRLNVIAMSNDPNYPRDLIGYGRHPVQANWPGRARVAVQFVLNYEEGGENCVLHGDPGSEQFLSEIVGAASYPSRHMSMESIYEYGSRAGVWRILREFEKRKHAAHDLRRRHGDRAASGTGDERSSNWGMRSRATAIAGFTIRTCRRSARRSTCASAWKRSNA